MPVHEGDDTLLRTSRQGCVKHADGAGLEARPTGLRPMREPRELRASRRLRAAR